MDITTLGFIQVRDVGQVGDKISIGKIIADAHAQSLRLAAVDDGLNREDIHSRLRNWFPDRHCILAVIHHMNPQLVLWNPVTGSVEHLNLDVIVCESTIFAAYQRLDAECFEQMLPP
jgi:hypothetical protein